jgi:hypothetical protein
MLCHSLLSCHFEIPSTHCKEFVIRFLAVSAYALAVPEQEGNSVPGARCGEGGLPFWSLDIDLLVRYTVLGKVGFRFAAVPTPGGSEHDRSSSRTGRWPRVLSKAVQLTNCCPWQNRVRKILNVQSLFNPSAFRRTIAINNLSIRSNILVERLGDSWRGDEHQCGDYAEAVHM